MDERLNFLLWVFCRAKLGDHVLDVCCGSGDLAFLLSDKVGNNGKVGSNFLFFHFVSSLLGKQSIARILFINTFQERKEWLLCFEVLSVAELNKHPPKDTRTDS